MKKIVNKTFQIFIDFLVLVITVLILFSLYKIISIKSNNMKKVSCYIDFIFMNEYNIQEKNMKLISHKEYNSGKNSRIKKCK